MSEWKEVKLAEVTSVLGDGIHGTPIYSDDGEYYFINGNNLQEGKIIFKQDTKRVSQEEYLKYKKNLTDRTILFSINGTVGNVAKYNNEPCILGKSACYFNVLESVDKDFIYYVVSSPTFVKSMSNLANGTTIKNVSLKQMREKSFLIPPIEEQRRIASILSSLDSKIECNRKICANLEAQAQALFKHWFIDFAPFKEGKFVESELGMIPEGWRVGTLGEIAEITMGQSPSSSSYNEESEGVIFYQGRTEFGFRFPGVRLYTTEPKRFAKPLSTLLSVRAPVGDVNVATERCCIGRGLASIESRFSHNSFIYYLLLSLKRRFDVYNGEGTVFGSINKDTLTGMKIVIPPMSRLQDFEEIAREMDNKIFEAFQEINRLSTLRDTLLPKLMSGQIKV